MSAGAGRVLACGDWLIRRACRRLPESARERELEWLGELPVILADTAVRFAWLRVLRLLLYVGGAVTVAHRMPKAANGGRMRATVEVARRSRTGSAGITIEIRVAGGRFSVCASISATAASGGAIMVSATDLLATIAGMTVPGSAADVWAYVGPSIGLGVVAVALYRYLCRRERAR